MASVLSALNKALTSTLDTVGGVANAVQQTVKIGTDYIDIMAAHVDRQSIVSKAVGKDTAAMQISQELEKIAAELDGNAKRLALFEEARKLFD